MMPIGLVHIVTLILACPIYGAKIQLTEPIDDDVLRKIPPDFTIENLELAGSQRRGRTTAAPLQIVTTKPAPVPASDGSEGYLYRLDNRDGNACILIFCDAIVEIDYMTNLKEKKEADVYVPGDVTRSGMCEDDQAKFTIGWKYYNWTIYFSKTPGGDHWYVSNMDLDVSTSEPHLEHINRKGSKIQFSTSRESGMLFPTPVGKSYSCNDETVVNLFEGDATAEIILRKLRMQPFIFKNNEFGPEHICTPGGQKSFRSETAPIAVGSTFAVLSILTVTGYGVYRYMKIKKVQYDTME